MALTKLERRNRIKMRIRKVVLGSANAPRLTVFRSNKEIYAQLVDDSKGVTLISASSRDKDYTGVKNPKIDQAKEIGKLIAVRAKEAGIDNAVFDRNGYLYHGRVKALADAAREAGLKF
ncbi:MAG: 50S ribosomal protein L18 [Bacteroidota bacterium]